jgi:hypothetical protein
MTAIIVITFAIYTISPPSHKHCNKRTLTPIVSVIRFPKVHEYDRKRKN